MFQLTKLLCHSGTCSRPGCSPEAGCQGHAWREQAAVFYRQQLEALVAAAATDGLVLTVEQRPLQPLAMGHFETFVSVRPARPRAP